MAKQHMHKINHGKRPLGFHASFRDDTIMSLELLVLSHRHDRPNGARSLIRDSLFEYVSLWNKASRYEKQKKSRITMELSPVKDS